MSNIIIVSLLLLTSGSQTQSLEKEYWDCDYSSTTTLMSASDAAHCGTVYQKLLKDKFDEDFAKFLVWWKENKEREHKLRSKQ